MGEAKRKKLRQQQVAGRCYLCGGTGLTKQHVWPDWAAPHLKKPEATYTLHTNRTMPVRTRDGRVGVEIRNTLGRMRQGQLNQFKIRKYCEDCNTIWMRKVEEAARPYAEPLMKGETFVLDESAQMVLARWLTLVLIVIESGDEETASLPDDVIRKFHDDGHPLSYGRFFIGPLNGVNWACDFWHQGFGFHKNSSPSKTNRNTTQTTTIGMGKTLVYLFSTELPAENLSIGIRRMVEIWPITQASIDWPIPEVWTDAEASNLASHFYRVSLKRAEWRMPPEPNGPMGRH